LLSGGSGFSVSLDLQILRPSTLHFDCFGHLGHSKKEKTEKSKVKQTSITVA
jgi:hypothetical protein